MGDLLLEARVDPFTIGVVLTLGLAMASDSERSEEEVPKTVKHPWGPLPDGSPSIAQVLGYVTDVYAIYATEDGYIIGADTDESQAMANARLVSDEPDTRFVEVARLVGVPMDIAEKLLVQGTREQEYSDGYDAGNAAAPYATDEDIWSWSIYEDSEFEYWPDEDKEEQRERVLEELDEITKKNPTNQASFPEGTLLFHGTAGIPWERDDVPDAEWGFALTTDFASAREHARRDAKTKIDPRPRVLTFQIVDGITPGSLVWLPTDKEVKRLAFILGADEDSIDEVAEKLCKDEEVDRLGIVRPTPSNPEARDVIICQDLVEHLELIDLRAVDDKSEGAVIAAAEATAEAGRRQLSFPFNPRSE